MARGERAGGAASQVLGGHAANALHLVTSHADGGAETAATELTSRANAGQSGGKSDKLESLSVCDSVTEHASCRISTHTGTYVLHGRPIFIGHTFVPMRCKLLGAVLVRLSISSCCLNDQKLYFFRFFLASDDNSDANLTIGSS